jgi:hypothetical protein
LAYFHFQFINGETCNGTLIALWKISKTAEINTLPEVLSLLEGDIVSQRGKISFRLKGSFFVKPNSIFRGRLSQGME